MTELPNVESSISIVVPVKNAMGTVRDLLDSLMKLDYKKENIEIIFVDGNSTDDTKSIIKNYPVLLVEEEGQGLNAARNTGVRRSTGKIIAFTDGDCIVSSNWAKSIVKNFRDPSVGFVGGLVEGYEKNSLLSEYLDETFFQAKPGFSGRKETTDLNLLQFPAGCNMAFRRHALEKINFFDERIFYGFDDLDPVEQLGRKGFRIVLDPDVLVWHRHRTSLKEMLTQHFNYGRGGALLIIYKRASRLSQWFTTYLFSSTFAIILLILMVMTGLVLNQMLPFTFIFISVLTIFVTIMAFYIKTAISSHSLKKLFLYPILDMARGLFFTFGGLTQLLRTITRKDNPLQKDSLTDNKI